MRLRPSHALCALLVVAAAACQAHPEGQRLLAEGQHDELLRRVRPVDGAGCWLRARALRAQGRLQQARTELLFGLTRDPRSAEGRSLLGYLEAQLGHEGAALASFERALEERPRQLEVRRVVGRLLVRRALLRADPAVGLHGLAEARSDLDRALRLDPSLAARAAELRARLAAPAKLSPSPVPGCPGPPLAASVVLAPTVRSRCGLRDASRLLEQLQQRRLLVGCEGAQLAARLTGQGCLDEALEVWRAMARETPSDPRWLFETGRTLLALGRESEAILSFGEYVYLGSEDRAGAALLAARALIAAGSRQPGARLALDAVTLTRRIEQIFEGARLLRDAGMMNEARAVIGTVARGDVRARLEEALGLQPTPSR